MFRKMRRFKQELSEEETEQILENGTTGILGVIGDDDYPYTVPVNYLYRNGRSMRVTQYLICYSARITDDA